MTRIDQDPELRDLFENLEQRTLERMKHNERERRRALEREERRRRRLQRLTFGLFPR
jgi:hypothetical protein